MNKPPTNQHQLKGDDMHRSNRYRIQTKLDRAVQNMLEARRSDVSFAIRTTPNRFTTMSYFTCDSCHFAFGTTWLDHCPSCGNQYLTPNDNLALAGKES
jgi:lipopolysaccharide biosynthesis regulator YciM